MRRAVAFVLGLFFLTTGWAAIPVQAAQQISQFGPEIFIRESGSPVTLTRPFDVPVARDGIISLSNGLEDDTTINELVSSSVITLNGQTLFGPSEFNQNVTSLQEPVTFVQGTNTLTVELRGKPGGALSIELLASDEPPTATFAANPLSGPAPLSVSFDASASSDPDNDITDYSWDFGDNSTGAGQTVSHTYSSSGTFTATLTVTDAFGLSSQATTTLTVIEPNTAPLASFTAQPQTGEVPLTVLFDATGSTDAENNIANYDWDFGDGTTGTGEIITHPYSTAGTFTATLTVTDTDGLSDSVTTTITVTETNTAPVASFTSTPTGGEPPLSVSFDASGSTDSENNIVSYSWNFGDGTTATGVTASHTYTTLGTFTVTLTVTDAGGLTDQASTSISVDDGTPNIPGDIPDAPTLDETVAYDVASSTSFLYTGTDPIQIGVAPETIEPTRAAVVRGQVFLRNGTPLPNVKVTILDHPEFGHTFTRADGFYDLAVNGGEQLVVGFELANHLTAQRKVKVPWQGFAVVDDVALITLDANVTTIDLSAMTDVTPHQGSVITDNDGTRQATLMFLPGTTAEMVLPDGTTQPLNTISVRATEYTVGDNGPMAMPAKLPSTSLYTYAAEFSLDEAIAVNANSVNFSQPVSIYVNNFLNFTAGTVVPSGFYDRSNGTWIASQSGRVIKILDTTGAIATLDIDGDDIADDAFAGLGITDAERQKLAELYAAGSYLWRVPVSHFSPFDFNWAWGLDSGAVPPTGFSNNPDGNHPNTPPSDPCQVPGGSVIGVESQCLGEDLSITGTSHKLNYKTNRVEGYRYESELEIPLIDATVPPTLDQIILTIQVSGREFVFRFDQDPATPDPDIVPDLTKTFVWDGLDAYGRKVRGKTFAHIRIEYGYTPVLSATNTFAELAMGETLLGLDSNPVSGRTLVTLSQSTNTPIVGVNDYRPLGLGGWTLDVNHTLDSFALHRGDGIDRNVFGLGSVVTTFHEGSELSGIGSDGAGNVYIGTHRAGSIFGPRECAITRISSSGTAQHIAGTSTCGFSGDGGPATSASVNGARNIVVDSKGNIIFADTGNNRIRKIDTNGIITTLVGGSSTYFLLNDTPRTGTDIRIDSPEHIALDNQDNLYIAYASPDSSNLFFTRIIRLESDGLVHDFAGGGTSVADNIPADQARINVAGMVVDSQGDVLFINRLFVSKIRSDGILVHLGGNGQTVDVEGVPALDSGFHFSSKSSISIDKDGNIIVATVNNIRKIGTDGIVRTIVGPVIPPFSTQENIPALRADLTNLVGMITDPLGDILLIDETGALNGDRVRKVRPILRKLAGGETVIPSVDGSQLFIFEDSGRHLKTVNTLTGADVFVFGYDADGRLITVTDGDGDITTFNRSASGTLTNIASQDGQVTTVTLNAGNYLESITNPELETIQISYDTEGRMTSFTDAKMNTSTFLYSGLGLLGKDTNAAGGFFQLARTKTNNLSTVTVTTAEGRVSTNQVNNQLDGTVERTVISPSGQTTTTNELGDSVVNTSTPDGTTIVETITPDPRFGMLAPLQDLEVTTPNGLVSSITATRSFTGLDPNDPLIFSGFTDTLNINGRTFTSEFDKSLLKFTDTSPTGRSTTSFIDAQGRITQQQIPNLFDTGFQYDARGRLTTVTQGTAPNDRQSTITYDAAGFIGSIMDPLGRSVQFEYDAVGRVTKQILPDLREINFTYDDNGNATSITPPGRPVHGFAYDAVNLETDYTPPNIGLSQHATQFSYNLDKQLTGILRPDGQTISLGYDTGGRLSTVTVPFGVGMGNYTYVYDAVTGNLTGITSPAGEGLGFGYDGSLLLGSTWAGTVSGSVSRTYDNDFRITSRSVNGANTISFGYDTDSLLTSAGSETLTYDSANGLLTGTTLGVVGDAFTYNGFGEISSYGADVSGIPVFETSFVRDKLGRIVEKTETVNGVQHVFEYAYDTAGRLVEVKKDSVVTATYSYDANGNRLNNGATYDDQDRLISTSTTSYTYTANGELLTKTEGADTTQYSYDVLGNLLSVALPDGTLIEYVVDGRNRRIGKKVNGVLTKAWLYKDGLNPIAELDGAGNVVSRFVYASRANVPDYMIKGGVTHRIVSDHLGSPRQVINSSDGTVIQELDYDAWGNVLFDTNPGFQPFSFAGGLYDTDTKLVRFGARDYDPEVGRWTSKDPKGFLGGDNSYYYVEQNPIMLIDPTGETPWGLVFAGANLALQLYQSGGNLNAVNWTDVGLSLLGGGLFNGLLKGAFKFKTFGSHTWSATRQWMKRRNIMPIQFGQQRHHWLFAQRQGIGKFIPDYIKNQPWNINPISSAYNNWLGRNPWLSPLGGPGWAGETAAGAIMASGSFGDAVCE